MKSNHGKGFNSGPVGVLHSFKPVFVPGRNTTALHRCLANVQMQTSGASARPRAMLYCHMVTSKGTRDLVQSKDVHLHSPQEAGAAGNPSSLSSNASVCTSDASSCPQSAMVIALPGLPDGDPAWAILLTVS